jgi:hypothetical protein
VVSLSVEVSEETWAALIAEVGASELGFNDFVEAALTDRLRKLAAAAVADRSLMPQNLAN